MPPPDENMDDNMEWENVPDPQNTGNMDEDGDYNMQDNDQPENTEGHVGENEETFDDSIDEFDWRNVTHDDKLRVKYMSKDVKNAVRIVHRNLGHPSSSGLLRVLRLARASPDALLFARCWRCPTCARRAAPASAPQAHAHDRGAKNFGEIVNIDLKQVYDSAGNHYWTAIILDVATLYMRMELITDKKGDGVPRLFADTWVSWAGVPKRIDIDLGGELISHDFADLMGKYGATPQVAPPARRGSTALRNDTEACWGRYSLRSWRRCKSSARPTSAKPVAQRPS